MYFAGRKSAECFNLFPFFLFTPPPIRLIVDVEEEEQEAEEVMEEGA